MLGSAVIKRMAVKTKAKPTKAFWLAVVHLTFELFHFPFLSDFYITYFSKWMGVT